MSSVSHHPKPETLAAFAAGRLDEARAVVIAAHAAICAQCSKAIAEFEALGGVCLEDIEPVDMAPDALEKILARAGDANVVIPETPKGDIGGEKYALLDSYLKDGLDNVPWKTVAPGFSQHIIEAQGYRKGVLRLLRIKPGVKVPTHSHKGEELTLILSGAYRDELGEWRAGDLADLDGAETHAPEAIGEEYCICLAATSAPLDFKTMVGRVIQPFFGM